MESPKGEARFGGSVFGDISAGARIALYINLGSLCQVWQDSRVFVSSELHNVDPGCEFFVRVATE